MRARRFPPVRPPACCGPWTAEVALRAPAAYRGRVPSLTLAQQPQADALLSNDPFALLVGMLLDQQFPMERAFAGPFLLAERLGDPTRLDPAVVMATDLDRLIALAQGPPAIHRYPGSMARRIQDLAAVVVDDYDGDAARIWTTGSGGEVLKRLKALPGFGDQKAKIFLAVQIKVNGLDIPGGREACAPYGEPGTFMSVADVTGPDSLAKVREWKQEQKRARAAT